jgi:hypothetical protein
MGRVSLNEIVSALKKWGRPSPSENLRERAMVHEALEGTRTNFP